MEENPVDQCGLEWDRVCWGNRFKRRGGDDLGYGSSIAVQFQFTLAEAGSEQGRAKEAAGAGWLGMKGRGHLQEDKPKRRTS